MYNVSHSNELNGRYSVEEKNPLVYKIFIEGKNKKFIQNKNQFIYLKVEIKERDYDRDGKEIVCSLRVSAKTVLPKIDQIPSK